MSSTTYVSKSACNGATAPLGKLLWTVIPIDIVLSSLAPRGVVVLVLLEGDLRIMTELLLPSDDCDSQVIWFLTLEPKVSLMISSM